MVDTSEPGVVNTVELLADSLKCYDLFYEPRSEDMSEPTIPPPSEPIASVRLCCGRLVLFVADIAVAMEGDKCRHSGFPESVLPPIPPEELENARIGDKKASELPIEVVRFFRGDLWAGPALEHAAEAINRRCHAAESDLAAIRELLRPVLGRETCPTCVSRAQHFEVLPFGWQCGACSGTGTRDAVDGLAPVEAVVRCVKQMDEMECAGTSLDTIWRAEKTAYYEAVAERDAARAELAAMTARWETAVQVALDTQTTEAAS